MIKKIRSFFRCKLRDKHMFVQTSANLVGEQAMVYWKCKLCGKEVRQTMNIKKGEFE